MARVLILVESSVFVGFLLIANLLRRLRRGNLLGGFPIHPLLFVIGKLSMGISWGLLFAHAVTEQSYASPMAEARQYVAAALLLPGILFAIPSFLELGSNLRLAISDNTDGLRTDGIYRASRNPMYLAFFMVTLASLIAAPHLVNIACGLVGIYVHHRIVLAEERFLLEQYGASYEAYRRKVRRYL